MFYEIASGVQTVAADVVRCLHFTVKLKKDVTVKQNACSCSHACSRYDLHQLGRANSIPCVRLAFRTHTESLQGCDAAPVHLVILT